MSQMHRPLALLSLAAALFAPQNAVAAERMLDLVRDGYQLIYTDPYLAIEGCEYSKRVLVGPYTFMCRTDEYVFHYGKAALLSRTPASTWLFMSSAYICVDPDHCLAGELKTR
jgi:hypothetical protein